MERSGAVVQLVRIPACHAGGRGFESRPLRQQVVKEKSSLSWIFFVHIFCLAFSVLSCVHFPDSLSVPPAILRTTISLHSVKRVACVTSNLRARKTLNCQRAPADLVLMT